LHNEVISVEQNVDLCVEVTEEEVEGIIKSMPLDKAPGLDEITVEFYIKCWPTVKSDFIVAVRYFFTTSHLPP